MYVFYEVVVILWCCDECVIFLYNNTSVTDARNNNTERIHAGIKYYFVLLRVPFTSKIIQIFFLIPACIMEVLLSKTPTSLQVVFYKKIQ